MRSATNGMAPPLNAALVTRWLEDGSYDRLIAETRAEAQARLAIAAEILPPGSYAAHPCGYHLWMPLPADADQGRIAGRPRLAGLVALPDFQFSAGEGYGKGLRISLGGAIDRAGLRRGLTMLAAGLASSG